MAKGDRKFNQLTRGIRLTEPQKRSVRKQILSGVSQPTLRVFGETVTLSQLKVAQELTAQSQEQKRAKAAEKAVPRLRYNKQGIATTSSGVKITREEARAFRAHAQQINRYSAREQYKATLAYTVELSRSKDTDKTKFYPAAARNAPLPYQKVDFSQYKTQEEFKAAQAYQTTLYNPKTKTSERAMYLADVMKSNWRKALIKQVGAETARPILRLVDKLPSMTFKHLIDAGILPTVGDVYYVTPEEVEADLDNYLYALQYATTHNSEFSKWHNAPREKFDKFDNMEAAQAAKDLGFTD